MEDGYEPPDDAEDDQKDAEGDPEDFPSLQATTILPLTGINLTRYKYHNYPYDRFPEVLDLA